MALGSVYPGLQVLYTLALYDYLRKVLKIMFKYYKLQQQDSHTHNPQPDIINMRPPALFLNLQIQGVFTHAQLQH